VVRPFRESFNEAALSQLELAADLHEVINENLLLENAPNFVVVFKNRDPVAAVDEVALHVGLAFPDVVGALEERAVVATHDAGPLVLVALPLDADLADLVDFKSGADCSLHGEEYFKALCHLAHQDRASVLSAWLQTLKHLHHEFTIRLVAPVIKRRGNEVDSGTEIARFAIDGNPKEQGILT
jgi:hypothetical protein